MVSRRSFTWSALGALAALVLASSPSPAAAPLLGQSGRAQGVWQLPMANAFGLMDGFLYEASNAPTPAPVAAYHLSAGLAASPVMCPNCVAGVIYGTLDDGSGGAAEYHLLGTYSGTASTGQGSFTVSIYEPNNNAPVGRIRGHFDNPPLLPAFGRFKGKWAIR
jgi:hypothetical protein